MGDLFAAVSVVIIAATTGFLVGSLSENHGWRQDCEIAQRHVDRGALFDCRLHTKEPL